MTQKIWRTIGTVLGLVALAVAAYSLGEGNGLERAVRSEQERRQQLEQLKQVFVNEGGVCFETGEEENITAVTAPVSCFPSCLRHDKKSVVAVVDRKRNIRLQTHFYSTHTSICATADCGGVPKITFDLGVLETGSYRVWLGKRQLGRLTVPLTKPSVCLGISAID